MNTRTHSLRRLGAGAIATCIVAGTAVTLGASAAGAADLPETFLSTATTTWSYSDDNTDPAAGASDRLVWTEAGFDDATWKTATGAFGAKNGEPSGIGESFPITTGLSQYIPGTTTDVPTFHFRTSFDIDSDQLDEISGLSATVTYDDALQVFVNGEKVAGFIDEAVEAAPEAERNLMYAGASNGDPVTSTFTIDADDLVAGENTVAVALHQDRASSSDIYFDFASLTPVIAGEEPSASYSDVVLTIAADESARNVTWYTNTDTEQVLQYAVAGAGEAFPADGITTVEATGGVTTSGEYNRRAALTDLAENTSYVYRLGSEAGGWSETRTFSTASFTGDYGFLFFGDPQIGASGNAQRDGEGWADTLDVAVDAYPDSELLFSAGDQVNTASSEQEYEYYFAPPQMSEIPTAPINGNHDVGSKAYEQHYTVPNLDPNAGPASSGTSSGGDYWFMYKDVLYVMLNTNSSDDQSHIDFMEKVVAEHGAEAKWQVLGFHHSIYSVASHVYDTQIERLRNALPTAISDLGFDLVLQGHDHSYTRTYLIKDGELADAAEVPGQAEVSAGEGEVLYVTANSASGSKYYDVKAPDAWYGSVINQEKVRNYSHIAVADGSITVTTLRSQASGDKTVNSVVDEVTLVRDDVAAPAPAPKIALTGDPVQGGEVTFAGSGFTPGESVNAAVHSDPVELGAFVVGEDGTFSIDWTIPADFAVGEHSIVVTLTDGTTVTGTFAVTAAATDGSGDGAAGEGLATTGAELPLTVLGLALALLIGGAALVIARRRAAAARD